MSDISIQAIGLIAAALSILSYLSKDDQYFKVYSGISLSIFALHFFMLGAYAGMAAMLIAAIRNVLSIKFHGSSKLMWFIIAIYCSMVFWYIDDIAGLLLLFSGVANTYGVYQLSGVKMRLVTFISSCSWIIYGFIHKSIGGVLVEILLQIININTISRIFRDKKHERNSV